jgi:ESCRT-II complex subunit VPS36
MFFKKPDLTAGSRPTLSQDEVLLFVQDGVGLYEGYIPGYTAVVFTVANTLRKYKVDSCQKGHAYLTSHRACYVDDAEPRSNSWAVDLKDVDRHEFQVRRNSFPLPRNGAYQMDPRLGFSNHRPRLP